MLTRDDVIVLEDWLKAYRDWFDEIFVLDGSIIHEEQSKKTLLKYETRYYHDREFDFLNIYNMNKSQVKSSNTRFKTDHVLRGVLFEKIKKMIVEENNPDLDYWIVCAHPDEFYIEPFTAVIKKAYEVNTNLILYNTLYNIPHINDKKKYLETKDYKNLTYFVHNNKCTKKEKRLFKYSPKLYYSNRHGSVIPHNLDQKNSKIFHPNMFHYKILDVNIDNYTAGGSSNLSVWSGLANHYPPNHEFKTIDDFFLAKPAGKYNGQKFYKRGSKLPQSLLVDFGKKSNFKYNDVY